jgi:MFS family permease
MTVHQDAPAPSRIRDRLGLPDLTGRHQLAGALFVDSLGDGLFVPFAVVYFLKTTGLTLSTVGLGLTVANLLAMVAVPVSGVLIDRLTPAAVVIAGNLISGLGFAGYLLVGNLWELVFFSFFAAAGGRLFWTANLALVGDAFQGSERARWFAFQRAARNGGYGLGGLFAAAALGTGSGIGYRALALANAVTFLLAALLVWRSRVSLGGGSARKSEVVNGSRRGYRAALTDGPFLLLTAMNVLFVLCMMVLDVLLALYLVRILHEPVWLSGLLFTLNTLTVAGFQTPVWALFQHRHPVRVLQLSAAVWGLSFLMMWLIAPLPGAVAIAGVFLAVIVFTVAELIQGPVFNGLVVAAAPEQFRGRYMAVYQMSWALARAAAPGLFGWLFTADQALPWIVLAAGCAGCVLILATRVGRAIGDL